MPSQPPIPSSIDPQNDAEALLRNLIDAVEDYAIYMLDPQGHVLTWNHGAQHNKGYSADEIIGRHYRCFFTDEDIVKGAPEMHLELARQSGRFQEEAWRVRKDGTRFWADVTLTPMYNRGDGLLVGFAKITRDLTARKKQHEALQAAKENAESANRAKSVFLANMSHELRTPLNAIIGFSELMSCEAIGPLGQPRYREYASDILESGKHLLRLINNVLDLSRLDAGQVELHEDDIDVVHLTGEVFRYVQIMAEAKSIRLKASHESHTYRLRGDLQHLRQILINLLSNAVKFTPAGGEGIVEVSTKIVRGRLELSVSDNGIGMESDHIPVALARFGQIDSSFTRQHDGTGLGLTIVQELAALHGAKLAISSAAGTGTTITLSFPPERTLGFLKAGGLRST